MAITKRDITDRLPGWLRPGGDLVVDTAWDAVEDRVPGLAAEVAFYVLLSLPPLLLTLFAVAGLVASQFDQFDLARSATERTVELIGPFLDASSTDQIGQFVEQLVREARGGLVSIGFLLTVFTASRALRVLTVAITIAYDLEDRRPAWSQFAYGLALTVAILLASVVLVPILVAGPGGGQVLVEQFGLPATLGATWRIAYWPGMGTVAIGLLTLLYHVAAPWWTPLRRDLPGAALGALIVLGGTGALRVYTAFALQGDSVFGPFAAPIALMLWLYVLALGVLLGAELNAEIEKRWPSEQGPSKRTLRTEQDAPHGASPTRS